MRIVINNSDKSLNCQEKENQNRNENWSG